MLFPLSDRVPFCDIFVTLNKEFIDFLERSIATDVFDERLFSTYRYEGEICQSACWTNELTRKFFRDLWDVLPDDADGRRQIYNEISSKQDLYRLFSISDSSLVTLNEDVKNKISDLTKHLFVSSKNLLGIFRQAGKKISEHYAEFTDVNGSRLCYVCATTKLSQARNNIDNEGQWVSDYDHLLARSHYPEYAVHPGNLLPTCQVCNQKAKAAKNMLKKEGARRVAFYPFPPYLESCHHAVSVDVVLADISDQGGFDWERIMSDIRISFPDFIGQESLEEKASTWCDVYEVPSRVSAEISANFIEHIASDITAVSFADFSDLLLRRARVVPLDIMKTEWRFWWYKVYVSLSGLSQDEMEYLWSAIEWKMEYSSDVDMAEVFGV